MVKRNSAATLLSRAGAWGVALGVGIALAGWTPAAAVMAQAAAPAAGQAGAQGQAPAGGRIPQPGETQQGRQGGGRGRGNAPPAGPTPRSADGKVLLGGATPAEKGVWLPTIGITAPIAPANTVPFQPWARALFDERQKNELEPHTRCKASGVARQFETPYGVEFVELADLKQMYIFDIGGPHTYRRVYMDGRGHPDKLTPSYYGHSIGHWEGDTLVIDTKGFNEGFWLDRRGLPHTDQMQTVERFTRTDHNTINYEVTITDPGAYTAPWTGKFNLRWEPGTELFEYVCQEANYATELMVGESAGAAGKTSSFVP